MTGTWKRTGYIGQGDASSREAAPGKLKVLALTGCRVYTDTSSRDVPMASIGTSTAFIFAMQPAAAAGASTPENGRFRLEMKNVLRRGESDLLSSLLNAAGRFGSAVAPARAQVALGLSGNACDFWRKLQRRETAAMPPAKATVRDFLVRGAKEAPGYGLYSYLLLAHPPSSRSEVERVQAVISAYLTMLVEAREMPSFRPPQLNITYLPVKAPMGSKPSAEEALSVYDFDRSLAILLAQKGQAQPLNRPYLVSALVQLADVTAKADLFLIQDLSSIPPSVAPLYIREFEARVSQERSWTAANLDKFLLTIRSAIGSLASEVSAATPAFAVMIEVLKKAQ